ncbi:DUF4870 domain-containing protein [Paenibacillus spongiae]|uniref:DUF4870 domain-containing protein n=1 Tax=Paenibacillus spongiae TaxID=2909671 RepID=A0ABY5S8R7_9BACL|nr:DUF4870 domain-containing protein [Paenibacillus spongiae]UVI30311.1 DUF4870 domain-containing protein [Paenibacillus spongiae]
MQPYMPDRSSTGLDPRVVGLLCYLGCFVTGLLFLVLERQSRFVKFHAMQSVVVSVAFMVVNIVLGMLPIIGWLVGLILAPASFILWIALMVLALQGRWYKVPVLGEFAERQSQFL